MATDELPEIELGEDEVELMVFVTTTAGVRGVACSPLIALDVPDQIATVRAIAAQLRQAADRLESTADLAAAVDDIEVPT